MVEYPKNSRGSWSASLWSQTKVFQISFLTSSFLLIIMWIVGRLVWGCISFIRFGIWVIKLLNLCLWVLILDVDICVFFSSFNCNLLMISACCTLIYEPNLLKMHFFIFLGQTWVFWSLLEKWTDSKIVFLKDDFSHEIRLLERWLLIQNCLCLNFS